MRKILSLLLLVSVHAKAQTGIELILNPTQSQISSALELIRQRPEVKGLTPIYSRDEQKALASMGEGVLSQTYKFTVSNEQEVQALVTFIKTQRLPFTIDQNSLAIKMSYNMSSEQWGVRNDGTPQPLFVDKYSTLNIPGKPGEDIGKTKSIPAKSGKKIVAVLDTGVDTLHPALKGRIYRKEKECTAFKELDLCMAKANDIRKKEKGKELPKEILAEIAEKEKACRAQYANYDSDGNGYPMDCEGWNFMALNDLPNDLWGSPVMEDNDSGHGTHVAGIIAAAENQQGLKGCTDNALILPIKVIQDAPRSPVRPQSSDTNIPSPKEEDLKLGKGFGDVISRGLLYAIRSGVHVINMSLGWPAQVDSQVVRRMVALAQSRGIVVVTAGGNDSTDALIMPCVYPGVFCVGAHSNDGSIAHFSNYGSGIDFAAPGFRILSTYPMSIPAAIFTDFAGYEFKNGTSQATPFGACAAVDLLTQGFNKDEVYARLMLGSRPHQISTLRSEQMKNKFTLSGNLDIERSLSVSPQPFISLTKKEPISVLWDGRSSTIPIKFDLKNFWLPANNVSVSLSLGTDAAGLRVGAGAWSISQWPSGTEKTFEGSIQVDRNDFASEVTVVISVSVENGPVRRIPTQAVFAVYVNSQFAGLEAKRIPLSLKARDLRSVTTIEGDNDADYVVVEKSKEKDTIKLLREISGQYQASASFEVTGVEKATLKQIQKIDVNLDGRRDYVLIYRVPDPDVKKRLFSFLFICLDENFKPIPLPFKEPSFRMQYLQELAVLPPDFLWIRQGNFKLPAWVARGLRPADKTPDPWKLRPANVASPRLYFMSFKDLEAISDVDGYLPISYIKQDRRQLAAGTMTVLLAKTDGYKVQYATGNFSNGKVSDVKPLAMEHFRNLVGERKIDHDKFIGLDTRHQGNTFVTPIGGGKTRLTMISNNGEIIDKMLEPINKTDSVEMVSTAYWGERFTGVFAQTHYEMQYHDLINNTVKSTSLNRFSFMPVADFSRIFFAVTVQDEQLAASVPGLYVPAKLGVSPSSYVMVPRYTSSHQLVGVERPARMRFLTSKECSPIEDAVVSEVRQTTELVFNCGESIIRIPLKF